MHAKPDGSEETRAELYGENLPELPIDETMPDHWRELGYASSSPMGGLEPFAWSEIDAYNRLTGGQLLPIEAQCLMDMSRAYVRGTSDTNPLSIEPKERANG